MKSIRTELSSEGRLDILEKVMSYRGGWNKITCLKLKLKSTPRVFTTGSPPNRERSILWKSAWNHRNQCSRTWG